MCYIVLLILIVQHPSGFCGGYLPWITSLLCSWVLFVEVLNAEPAVTRGILVPWIVLRSACAYVSMCASMRVRYQVFYAISVVVSVVAAGIKLKVLIEQLRERRLSLTEVDDRQAPHAKKLAKKHKQLTQTTRTIKLLYASAMLAVCECLPLGVLQSTRGCFEAACICARMIFVCECSRVLRAIGSHATSDDGAEHGHYLGAFRRKGR